MRQLKIFAKILVTAISLVLVVYGAYHALSGPWFRLQKIEVQLQEQASYSAIFPQIKDSLDFRLMNLMGEFIWQLDLERVLQTVEIDQRIKDVKITRVLPNILQVKIWPHTPIANVLLPKSNFLRPISRNGDVLPAVLATEAVDGPVFRGEVFVKDPSVRARAVELLTLLPEEGVFSLRSVSELNYNKKKGFELIIKPTGTKVWIGFEDFKKRLSQAQRVMEYMQADQLPGRIIDARFAKKVVVKLRNAP